MANKHTDPNPASPSSAGIDMAFVIEGNVPEAARRRAEEMIRKLAGKAPRPILFARVKLTAAPTRPPTEDHLAQATLDVSGALLRSQVAAGGMIEAVNLLGRKLERRLSDLTERRDDGNARQPGTWRSGELPDSRPDYFPRPAVEREILRRKTWAGDRISVTDALFDLYALDHRFFLFTDDVDGVDSVVYEADGGVRLRRLGGDAPSDDEVEKLAIEVIETPAPELTSDDAIDLLDSSNEPFLFYRDAVSHRGCVLYRRYDGHYGLIEPRD